MKIRTGWALGVAVALLAAAGGYWLGAGTLKTSTQTESHAKPERKLLYYRNPMGLSDTSPVPKKDPMGMDYIAVYEGEEGSEQTSAGQVKFSTEKIQKLGVKTEAASLRVLDKTVRAAGRIETDERRTYTIAPKFEGYVERLHVSITGQVVGKGQPLFEVYSPELVSAQREYAIAAQGVSSLKEAGGEGGKSAQTGMKQLADASLMRLKNWDISDAQIKSLASSGATRRTLTFHSPVNGIITEKKAVQGMRFMPGDMLYQVADLSSVWVIADVFEQDIALVKNGAKANITINAYPDKTFEGKITYVYPTLKADTRTVQVRVELPNPKGLLKPAMFAQVEVQAGGKNPVLTIPNSAVVDSGTRRIAFVQLGEGRFEPRELKLGQRSDNYVEVLDGVKEGEQVVVAANFLIDAESNLKAAVGGFGHAGQGGKDKVGAVNTGHRAEGTVDSVDLKAGTLSLNHGPVATLNWPAMTMEFKVANAFLLNGLKPGAAVAVEFVERGPGEWVITSVKPPTNGKSSSAQAPAAPVTQVNSASHAAH